MWIHTAFSSKSTEESIGFMGAITVMLFSQQERREQRLNWRLKKKVDNQDTEEANVEVPKGLNEEDERLKKAATIGTALMVVNSHRTMIILMVIVIIFPMILVFRDINPSSENFVDLLLENNVVAKTRCDYLNQTVESWLLAASIVYSSSLTDRQDTSILWAQVLPERCDFQNAGGVITNCLDTGSTGKLSTGSSQDVISSGPNVSYYADILNIRQGGISDITRTMSDNNINYTVRVLINNNGIVVRTNVAFFLLLLSYLLLTIGGLQILQGDAGRLVLDPLQRMLKIVLRYAENPLAETQPLKPNCSKQRKSVINESSGDQASNNTEQLGNYETEQLINAITKIADLLRKCWGVAGAGIISSNLARTQDGKTVVFNPTVPGKRVYALFGFVGISGFGEQLRALDRDVMILINDVAKVVHDEVYRWALGNSGQCNKNLGSTFLMVFRIGDFTDVHERKRVATSLLFESKGKGKAKNTHLKSRHMGLHRRRSMREEFEKKKKARVMNEDDTLQLSTLPGISTFTDRALLGMLKSFAALHRDRAVQNWKKDFRLGAGVGAFSVEILIGMDAGWAVEGAVGSEYKIDATYLSPHVNMAARMMSATKQYGVTLLMSQAVKELLSKPARQQIRHIDTVYVKGSQVKQPIFTYDARHQGVNFFLFERSEEQSDFESESYVPTIWDDDQDLKAMRQHVTTEFANKFASGVKEYLAGRWKAAIETLTEANNIMITTVLDEGYIDYNPDDIDSRIFDRNCSDHDITRMRDELGDGACRALVSYMESRGGIPPANWDAVRPLTSK